VSTGALLYARRGYRKHGKLTFFGVFLLCAMLLVPNLLLDYATGYEMPHTLLDYLGVGIGILGLAIVAVSIVHFRSIPKMFCVQTGELTVTGPYRWSRNPQYVGYWLFLLGYALNDWSVWCLAALLAVAISLHFLILIEEEHLYRVFGEQYVEYRREIPRYFVWGRLRV
jgi:protein-S-isoprenylcysteine O-methyltransferase Ste14